VIVVDPVRSAVATPLVLIVATEGSLLVQFTDAEAMVCPYWSRTVAEN
jgi:hypothetical protein